jgi:hypothetical protein
VAPPVGEHLGYHLTDAGRARTVHWYRAFESSWDDPEHSKAWRAVTLR